MRSSSSFGFVDRRADVRRRVNRRARLHIDGSSRGCTVLEQSAGGARVELASDYPLPLRFELELGSPRLRVPVQVIWQNGLVAGLRFDARPFWLKALNLLAWFKGRDTEPSRAIAIRSGRKGIQ